MGWQIVAGMAVRALIGRMASRAAVNAARTSTNSYIRKYGPRYVTGLGVVSKVQDTVSVVSIASDYVTRLTRAESAFSKKSATSTNKRSRSMTTGYLRKYQSRE